MEDERIISLSDDQLAEVFGGVSPELLTFCGLTEEQYKKLSMVEKFKILHQFNSSDTVDTVSKSDHIDFC